MYILELTDKYIILYNQKKNILYKENIPHNIIVGNRIYDYEKLEKTLKNIINKSDILNSFFKIRIKILIFEKYTPAEKYLALNLFKNYSNIKIKLVYPINNYDDRHLLLSGEKIYYKHNLKLIPKQEYILIGYTVDNDILYKFENEYNIKLIKYENSNTIIYEEA